MHLPFLRYIYAPRHPLPRLPARLALRCLRWRFIVWGLAFRFVLTDWARLSVPGCEPGFTNVAACNSGSGENATATAKAKPAISVYLMLISRNLRFRYMRTACYRDCSAGR